MKHRFISLSAVIGIVLATASAAPGQCVTLGTPGLTGCTSLNGLLPSISCNSTTPNIGNTGFSIAGNNFQPAPWGTACGIYAPAVVFLLVGPCAGNPTPVPCGIPPFCNGTSSTVAYVDYFAFQILLAPAVLPTFPSFSPIWAVPIPNAPVLIGATLCAQAIQGIFVTSGCLLPPVFTCFAISHGLQITVLP